MLTDFLFFTSRVNQEPLDHLVNQAQQDLGCVSVAFDFSSVIEFYQLLIIFVVVNNVKTLLQGAQGVAGFAGAEGMAGQKVRILTLLL